MEKITVLYSRVSTEEQGNNGYSLDFQKYQLLEYAKNNEIENYVHFEEYGESATNMNRPKMKRILEMIKRGEVEEIVFYKIDRISRNILDFAELNKLCELANVKLTSMTEPIEHSAMGEFNQNIMIAIAELESKRISERSKSGYVGMLERGVYPFGGRMPIGISKTEDKQLYYNDDIGKVIEMYELNLAGMSHQDIIRMMKKKYNLNIAKNGMQRILTNELYQGTVTYQGKTYRFLEPIEVKGMDVPVFDRPKRNLYKHSYRLLKYFSDYKLDTKGKYNHSLGRMKYYTYYKHKEYDIIIQEEKFFRQLKKHINLKNEDTESVLQTQLKKLNELYVLSDMDKKQYDKLKTEIHQKAEEIWALQNVTAIEVDEDYNITIKYKKTELKFHYKK